MPPETDKLTPEQQEAPKEDCCKDLVDRYRVVMPHALPFKVFFDEIRPRRSGELAEKIRTLYQVPQGEELPWLDTQIAGSTAAYTALIDSKYGDTYSSDDEAKCATADAKLLTLLHSMQTSSLCFSGGGIRSASFCLGVLQSLSRFGFREEGEGPNKPQHMLCELDYLSTVSGGGYIGSWLMAWVKRLTDYRLNTLSTGKALVSPVAKQEGAKAFREALSALAGNAPHTSADPAPRAIRHLREYTNYLAPKFGLTLDTWSLVAIVFRNLLVNWVMILPLFLCAIAFVQVIHFGTFQLAAAFVHIAGFPITFGVATALFLFAGAMAGLRMPSRQAEKLFAAKLEPKAVFGLFILPLAVSSVFLLAIWLQNRWLWFHRPYRLLGWFALSAALSFAMVSVVRTTFTEKLNPQYSRVRRYVMGVFSAAVAGAILSVTLFALGTHAQGWMDKLMPSPTAAAEAPKPSTATLMKLPDNSTVDIQVKSPAKPRVEPPDMKQLHRPEVRGRLQGEYADIFILCGFPLVWGVLMAASSLYSAFLSDYEDDIDREWWARAGGMMMYCMIFWVVSQGIVIFAPQLFGTTFTIGKFSSAGFITGLLGALGGFSTSAGTGGTDKKADTGMLGRLLNKFNLVLPAICCAALLALAMLLANFEMYLATRTPFANGDRSLKAHVCIFLATAVVSLIANFTININIFSLHGMYRMRLMRAFLGSSNTRRKPDKFTGFDDRDIVWEDEVPCEPGVPLHLIHTTVNLVGTQNLSWAQRKAEGFTISPLHCGGWRMGYVPTKCYGGPRGISLATAMAISGAAFNPNMGYHSSPLVTLIMTLFNLRLGWWLPNPRYQSPKWAKTLAWYLRRPAPNLMAQKSPVLALRPLLAEMFGGTDDTSAYIELTDGGHFDNLGLYEMVLRRSHRIIVVDVGADPDAEFEDLGNAVRKIEIDLGIPIEFRKNKLHMEKGSQTTNMRCAIADIHYECVDGKAAPKPGVLIYIKAGMNGEEPPDIRQYALTHPTFPHENTANQFFNESQFESYRHLGSFTIDQIVSAPVMRTTGGAHTAIPRSNMAAFFDMAENYVNSVSPPAKKTADSSTEK